MKTENFVHRQMRLVVLISIFLSTILSCGKTDFFPKDVKTEGLTGDDETDKTWGDPGTDNTDIDIDHPSTDTIIDEFIVDDSEQRPLDILWVIDNSGSMDNEQQALANNFNSFISQFVLKDIDFSMAITTTDGTAGNNGEPVAGSMESLNYGSYQADSNQFLSNFSSMIKVGSTGSGNEKGLLTSKSFFEKYGAGFIRDDSNLVIVYVSDEEDQSGQSVDFFTSAILALKPANSMVQIHSVVRTEILESGSGVTNGGARYVEASEKTNGSHEEITNDFGQILTNIGTDIINKIENYVLSKVPDLDRIKVYVNGVVQYDGWSYNSQKNSIEFEPGFQPAVGSKIVVGYLEK